GGSHTLEVFAGEVLLVDVVGKSDHRDTGISLEGVDISARGVESSFSETAVHTSELALVLATFRDDVQCPLRISVIEAGELRLFTQAVEDFDPFDDFGGQVLKGNSSIVAEEFFTVYEDLPDGFTMGFYAFAVGCNARHFIDEVFGRGIRIRLVGVGVIQGSIALLFDRDGWCGDFERPECSHSRGQGNIAKVDWSIFHRDGERAGTVPDVSESREVLSRFDRAEGKFAVSVRDCSSDLGGVVGVHQEDGDAD